MSTQIHNDVRSIPDEHLPPVVVALLAYNRAEEAISTFDILLETDYPADRLHLLLLDNASTDGTPEQVRSRYGDRVEIMSLRENVGPVGRNRVMLTRPEPYIFMLDEDCAPQRPDIIRRAVEFMEANPYFGALCFGFVNGYTGAPEFGNLGAASVRRLKNGAGEVSTVVGGGMCFRREAIQQTDGYDERLFWGGEEHELALSLMYHNVPIVHLPDLILVHRQAPRALPPARALRIDMRNNVWITFKYFPLPLALPVLFLLTLRRVLAAVLRRKPGGMEALFLGLREGWAALPEIMAERKPIPVSRLARFNRWFFGMFYPPSGRR